MIPSLEALLADRRGPPVIFAGPCVLEPHVDAVEFALQLRLLASKVGVFLVFKASYSKANRTSGKSYRGVGVQLGRTLLNDVRCHTGLLVVTDVHTPAEVPIIAPAVDILQIPAFLCRQTELLEAAGATGKPVLLKKGQFASNGIMRFAVEKLQGAGCPFVMLGERGTLFGPGQLVNDFAAMTDWVQAGSAPLIFDATHSTQRPGVGQTDGDWTLAFPLLRAALALGVHGFFMETHPDPTKALSDKSSQIPFRHLERIWQWIVAARKALPSWE